MTRSRLSSANFDDASLAGIVRVFGTAVSALSMVALARRGGSEAIGRASFVATIAFFSAMATGAGLPGSVLRFGRTGFAPRIRRATVSASIAAAFLSAVGASAFSSAPAATTATAGAILGASFVLLPVASAWLTLEGSVVAQAFASTVSTIMAIAIAYPLMELLPNSRETVAVTFTVISVGAATLISLGAIRRGPAIPSVEIGGRNHEYRSFGFRSWSTNVTQTITTRLDSAILGALALPTELGRYAVMLKAAEAVGAAIQARSSSVIGRVARTTDDEANLEFVHRSVIDTVRVWVLLSLLSGIGFGVLAPTVLGASFERDRWWFTVLVVPYCLLSVSAIYSGYFAAQGELRPSLRATNVGFVLSVVLYVALVPRFGLPGACASTAVVSTVQADLVRRSFIARRRLQKRRNLGPSRAHVACGDSDGSVGDQSRQRGGVPAIGSSVAAAARSAKGT